MKINFINFHIGLKYMDLANYFFLKFIGILPFTFFVQSDGNFKPAGYTGTIAAFAQPCGFAGFYLNYPRQFRQYVIVIFSRCAQIFLPLSV